MRSNKVREAIVVVRGDTPEDRHLVAYVVPREAASAENPPSVEELHAELKGALPAYMVPSAFVMLERMPHTPSGKLDRRALPAPGQGAYMKQIYEAPVGSIEETIAEVWRKLLRLDRLGRRDNFFELGGHSLTAARAVSQIRDRLNARSYQ